MEYFELLFDLFFTGLLLIFLFGFSNSLLLIPFSFF